MDEKYKDLCLLFTTNRELISKLQSGNTSFALLMETLGWTAECAVNVYGVEAVNMDAIDSIWSLLKSEEYTYHCFTEFFKEELTALENMLVQYIVSVAVQMLSKR